MRSEFPAMRFPPALLLPTRPRNCARVADNFLSTTDRGVASSNPACSATESVHFCLHFGQSRNSARNVAFFLPAASSVLYEIEHGR